MQRLFIILAMVGIVTACGRSTPAAQAPQVVEVTKIATVEVRRVVTSVVVMTATARPMTEATATAPPTAEATATVPPTAEATAVPLPPTAVSSMPTTNSPTASVVNGGNLRSETTVSARTVIGQVCPGDRVVVLTQQSVGAALWYKVQIITTASDCHPTRVAIGTEGWISSSLVSQPGSALASVPITVTISPSTSPTSPTSPTHPTRASIKALYPGLTWEERVNQTIGTDPTMPASRLFDGVRIDIRSSGSGLESAEFGTRLCNMPPESNYREQVLAHLGTFMQAVAPEMSVEEILRVSAQTDGFQNTEHLFKDGRRLIIQNVRVNCLSITVIVVNFPQ